MTTGGRVPGIGSDGRSVRRRDPLAHPEQLIQTVYAYVALSRRVPVPMRRTSRATCSSAHSATGRATTPKRGEPVAWLIGIARRCIDGVVLRSATAPSRRSRTVLRRATSPRRPYRRLTLSAAVADLGERDRELIALRYGADLTGRQIGEILDMSVNAVDVAVHRAVERLKQMLDEAEVKTR